MTIELKRLVKFTPGYDRKAEGYGIHGGHLVYLVTGQSPEGLFAVEYSIYTQWMPKSVHEAWDVIDEVADGWGKAHAWGLSYHSPVRIDEWGDPVPQCLWTGGECWSGELMGSDFWKKLFKRLCTDGEDPVWEVLETKGQEVARRIQEALEDERRYS